MNGPPRHRVDDRPTLVAFLRAVSFATAALMRGCHR